MATPSTDRRCDRHGLATGPDGRCIVCRREEAPEAPSSRGIVLGAAALLLVVIVAGVAYVRRPRASIAPDVASTTSPASATHEGAMAVDQSAPTPTIPQHVWPPEPVPSAMGAPTTAPPAPARTIDPLELRTAARSVHIVMYTTSWCPRCREARTWFADNGVRYEEHDIEASDASMRACKKLNPKCSIPTTDIDGEVIVGFGADSYRSAIDRAALRRLTK